MTKWSLAFAAQNLKKIQESNTTTFHTTAVIDVSTEWCRPSAMMIPATVDSTVATENSKSMSMPMCILCPQAEKDGVWVLERRSREVSLSCSTSGKYFQLTQKLERPNSRSTVNQHAPIWWKLPKVKSSIRPTKAIWLGSLTILVNRTVSLKNGTFSGRSGLGFLL